MKKLEIKLKLLLDIVNSDMLMDMVNEVNSWDSSLEYLNYIDMDMLEDYLLEVPAVDVINKVYYGDFNPNDLYFQFDAYANLVSYTDWEVEQDLEDYKEDIVKRFIELYEDGNVESSYQEIYDILDNEDIEEEYSKIKKDMLEALANLYGKKLLWLLALGEDKYFELPLEERKDIQTMIAFIKRHLAINELSSCDLADYLEVDEEEFFDMCEIILCDILHEGVENLC